MQIIITNNEPCPIAFPSLVPGQTITLAPGANLVECADWTAAKKLPVVAGWLEKPADVLPPNRPTNAIKTLVEGERMGAGGIADMKNDAAIRLVSETMLYPTLKEWLAKDTRADVKAAIEAQLHFIDTQTNAKAKR